MNTLQHILHCNGCTDRLTYQRNVALLALGKATLDLLLIAFGPDLDVRSVALAWVNPFVLVRPWLDGTMPLLICLGTLLFFTAVVWNSVHRARDAGWNHWSGLLTAVPFIGLAAMVVLAMLPRRKRTVWDLV